ncbi:alanine racemase [Streptococcus infantarius subsp. infantarius]|uniref:alanine racemase n=1 Tax=Streptococcus infantarius TaxID=102684 RepID=UPI00208EDA6C|nr:alanine racemase [Streptococcus infantarius subsp. infantarius]MCO4478345.1 alanine racemase [Streptococcus infantarius subsp. infantarius]MCO4527485.1 alanine racemase [Streptococcus infantarius subsp. infantarius]
MISSLHRPTRALIDLGAICDNIETVKANIPEGKKVFAVVKANAYGHGAKKVAQAVHHLVDGFCVSNVDEALELREAGIEETILILGVIMPNEVALARDYDITLTVASQEWLDLANEQDISLKGVNVHLKVDSGMGRIGVRSLEEAESLMANLKKAGANVEGIFTHFATADEADDTKFNEQLAFFTNIVNNLSEKPALVHASNSATSIWHSETIFNIVRLGIVMYGLNPSGTDIALPYPIKPALSLESALVHVKTIPAGATVGYGATYTAQKEEYIATVPIGYADGWTRDLQGFSVLVNGQFCEIVGRVSMDQITIRLPEKFPIGTKVTLIGQEGDKAISATDLAQKCGTINYEVLCLLSDRIPRFYSK